MRVLVVTNMYPSEKMPFYGIFIKEQVESLRELGVNVDVFFINGKANRFNYIKEVPRLCGVLRENRFDVIHLHHTYCVFVTYLAKKLTGDDAPVVLTLHEGEAYSRNVYRRKGDVLKRFVYSRRLKRTALEMVDHVITVHEDLVRVLDFRGRFVTIPCGVDLDLFRPIERKIARKLLGLPGRKKIVFFPASPRNRNKGYEILEKAIDLIQEEILLVTAGNILHEEIPIYMAAADVVVQLSEYEASPMVLKEAMAVNVPVIFTDVGDARFVVGDTEGCFITERVVADVARNLKLALDMNGKSAGRSRIMEAGLSLRDVGQKVVSEYERMRKIRLCAS